jgi:hypothetical protein
MVEEFFVLNCVTVPIVLEKILQVLNMGMDGLKKCPKLQEKNNVLFVEKRDIQISIILMEINTLMRD